MKRLIAPIVSLAVAVLGVSLAPASQAAWAPEDGDEAFTLGGGWPEGTPGWLGVTFESNGLAYLWPSRMAGRDASGTWRKCESLDEGWCANALTADFYAILPTCTSGAEAWCIESVRANTPGQGRVNGTILDSYPASGPGVFPGNAKYNLPEGATPTLWNLPGIAHSGAATTYLSTVGVLGWYERNATTASWQGPTISFFTSLIYPVKVQQGEFYAPKLDEGGFGLMNWGFGPECAAATDGSCARRYAFPPDTRFGMTIRLGKAPGSFFHGRLVDPNVSIKDSTAGIAVDIEANPAKVPVVATWKRWADLPAYIREMYPLGFNGPSIDMGSREWLSDVSTRVMMSTPTAGGTRSMNELSTWLKFLGDRATAVPSIWSFSTVPFEEMRGVNSCFTKANRVNGLVTTNATSYSAGPPALDKKTQTLNYQVAAPHFTRTGEVFSGSYTLALRSDVARCIYGFTNAPIKATVQVLDAQGDTKVATTSVAEKDGWITLSAQGFDFSRPTVSVKLTGKKKKR